jgi:hypothetical protein
VELFLHRFSDCFPIPMKNQLLQRDFLLELLCSKYYTPAKANHSTTGFAMETVLNDD